MTELVKEKDRINIDKNIVDNLSDFSVYGKDQPLVKSLLYYFAYQHRYQPEQFGVLDPEDFAIVCGFTPGHLRCRHEDPAILAGKTQKQIDRLYAEAEQLSERKVLDSNLENALYKLLTTNIIYQQRPRVFTLKDNTMIHETDYYSFNFLKNLKVRQITTPAGRQKTIYNYEVTESFINHMGLYFMPCNLQDLVLFRKSRRDDLYLFLIRAREYCLYGNINQYQSNLDQLCTYANLSLTSDREKKRKINDSFKDFKEKVDFDFDLQWKARDGERWEYVPVLFFPDTSSKRPKDYLVKEKFGLFYNNLVNELGMLYKSVTDVIPFGQEYVSDLLNFIQNGEYEEEKIEKYWIAEKRTYTTQRGAPSRAKDFVNEATRKPWTSFDDMKKALWVYHQTKNSKYLTY